MSNVINRGRAFYALKECKNVWCKNNGAQYKLKSVPYGVDFVIALNNDEDLKLSNSGTSFFVKYEKKPKKEIVYESRKVLKDAKNTIHCIFKKVENDLLIVKAAVPPYSEIPFRDCIKGHLPNDCTLEYYKEDLFFKLGEDILSKFIGFPINTILKIETDRENKVVFIGEFIGGEMVYCYGDKPEWFNDYREIFGEYEYQDIAI